MSRSQADYVRREADPEYVEAVQGLRRSSSTRPHGSLRGRNRQNENRAAIDRDRRESE